MSSILEHKQSLIVAQREYFPLLFRFKNKHPDLDIKIMSREDFVSLLSFAYTSNVIPYLMEHDYEYTKAKKMMALLPIIDTDQNPKTKQLYKDLDEGGYLKIDEFASLELNRAIFLFESQDDQEIKNLITRKGKSFEDVSIEELDVVQVHESFLNKKIVHFDNKFAQFSYIFSDIRKRILENEKDESPDKIDIKNKIKILVSSDSDIFYVKLCSSLYKIDVYVVNKRPIMTNEAIKNKVAEIYKTKSFDCFNEEELNNEGLNLLNGVIEEYEIRNLKKSHSFEYAYANLIEILNGMKYEDETEKKGILVTNRIDFDPDSLIYVTCFQHDCFYKVYDDDNVLNDSELKQAGANPSYVKTLIDRRVKENYLKYNNVLLLSRVEQHLSEKIYESQFYEDWKEEGTYSNGITKIALKDCDGIFTSESALLEQADELDKLYVNEATGKINSYDHSFTGIEFDNGIFTEKERWSVTDLESYVGCPFKYYLNKLLPPLDDDYHARCRGTLIHKVFESINHKDYDFETAFNEGREEYIKQYNETDVFGPKEEAYIQIMYHWLKDFAFVIRQNYEDQSSIIPNENDFEQKVYYSLYDEDGTEYKLSGKIDKILWTTHNGKNYYTIVDYKTGSETFEIKNVFMGKSTQLPLYYYAITQQSDDKLALLTNYGEFGGFGIQHIYFRTPKKAFIDSKKYSSSDQLLKASRIKGISLEDEDYVASINRDGLSQKDGKILSNGGSVVQRTSAFVKVDGEDEYLIKAATTTLPHYNVDDMVQDAIDSSIRTIKDIKDKRFEIAPKSMNFSKFDLSNLSCKYCMFRDICYVKKSQDAVDLTDEFYKHFNPPQDEIDEENFDEGGLN